MKSRVRVLIVDDSSLFVEALTASLEADGDIEIVGVADNGRDAVARVAELRPDLVTMDVNMPVMDGLEAIERIMASHPTPILVVTADSRRRGEHGSFEALCRGALDLVSKSELDIGSPAQQQLLRERARLLAATPVVYRPRRARRISREPGFGATTVAGGIGIVASTGGPPALAEILAALPSDFPMPVVVVQHLATGFADHLVSWLAEVTSLSVRLAAHGQRLAPATVFVAPDGAHLEVAAGNCFQLDRDSPPLDSHRPSGTRLLDSMARVWGGRAVGVVLSGMGADGGTGLLAIHRAGGVTIAQDRATSAVYGMPRAAHELGAARYVLASSAIGDALYRVAGLGARSS